MPSLPFDESNTFTPPSAFGPYRVLHQIGSGVLGPVFRTYDPQSDRLVAVKAFRLDLLPEDVARLADGLRLLVGTAGYVGAGLEGTTAYLAMDYHAAETLDVALRHLAPAPLESALPILRGIADAIDSAWTTGSAFGHGTLHPRDVFLTPGSNETHVTGFGVAPALGAIGQRPPVRRPYTAPERASEVSWDVRADVYSLGAIAHELLTGRRPAGPGEQDGTLPASMAPEVRVRIRRVLSKALAELPAHRFASAREFIEALEDPSALGETDAPISTVEPWPTDVVDPRPALQEPLVSSPAVVRRQRARQPVPVPRAPVRVIAREPLPTVATTGLATDSARDVDDAPLHPSAPPPRIAAMSAPLVLPPPFPWVAVAAVAISSLILGAAGGYQLALQRRSVDPAATSAPASVISPRVPPASGPISTAPAPGDTEVTITDAPAPSKHEPASKTSAASAKPAPTPGRVVVRSTPSGAAVTIDGKAVGRTPLTARDLPLAAHTVVVSRPGFGSETRRVTLTPRAPTTGITVTLNAERSARPSAGVKPGATGSVTVDSRPKGAQVTIDGRAVGVTPVSVPGLTPGAHAVRVQLARHKPVTTTVTVKAGETARLAVTLEQR